MLGALFKAFNDMESFAHFALLDPCRDGLFGLRVAFDVVENDKPLQCSLLRNEVHVALEAFWFNTCKEAKRWLDRSHLTIRQYVYTVF